MQLFAIMGCTIGYVCDELWFVLQVVGPSYDIAAMFNPWLYQMGFPIINITERQILDNIIAEPNRFLYGSNDDPTEPPSDYK